MKLKLETFVVYHFIQRMTNKRRARNFVAKVVIKILLDESSSYFLSDLSDDCSYIPYMIAVRGILYEDRVSDVDEQPEVISADSDNSDN